MAGILVEAVAAVSRGESRLPLPVARPRSSPTSAIDEMFGPPPRPAFLHQKRKKLPSGDVRSGSQIWIFRQSVEAIRGIRLF